MAASFFMTKSIALRVLKTLREEKQRPVQRKKKNQSSKQAIKYVLMPQGFHEPHHLTLQGIDKRKNTV